MTSYDTKQYDVVVQMSEHEFEQQLASRISDFHSAMGAAENGAGDDGGQQSDGQDIKLQAPYVDFGGKDNVTLVIPFDNSYLDISLGEFQITEVPDFQGQTNITQGITVRREDNGNRNVILDFTANPTISVDFNDRTENRLKGLEVGITPNGEYVAPGVPEAVETVPLIQAVRDRIKENTRRTVEEEFAEVPLLEPPQDDEGQGGGQDRGSIQVDQSADAPARTLFEIDAGIVLSDRPDRLNALTVVGWFDEAAAPEDIGSDDRKSPGEVLSTTAVTYDRPVALIADSGRLVEEFLCPHLAGGILDREVQIGGEGSPFATPCRLEQPTQATIDGKEVTVQTLRAVPKDGHIDVDVQVKHESPLAVTNIEITMRIKIRVEDGELVPEIDSPEPQTDVRMKPLAYATGVAIGAILGVVVGPLLTTVQSGVNAWIGGILAALGQWRGTEGIENRVSNETDESIDEEVEQQRSNMGDLVESLGPLAAEATFSEDPDQTATSLIFGIQPDVDAGAPIASQSAAQAASGWVALSQGEALDLDTGGQALSASSTPPNDFDLLWEGPGGNLRLVNGASMNSGSVIAGKPFDAILLADLQRLNYDTKYAKSIYKNPARTTLDANAIPEASPPAVYPSPYTAGIRTTERQYTKCQIMIYGGKLLIRYVTYETPDPGVELTTDSSNMSFVTEYGSQTETWATVECDPDIFVNGTNIGGDINISQRRGTVEIRGFMYNPITVVAETQQLALPLSYEWFLDGKKFPELEFTTEVDGIEVQVDADGPQCRLTADSDTLRSAIKNADIDPEDPSSSDERLVSATLELRITENTGLVYTDSMTVVFGQVIKQGGAPSSSSVSGCLDSDQVRPAVGRDRPIELFPPGTGDIPGVKPQPDPMPIEGLGGVVFRDNLPHFVAGELSELADDYTQGVVDDVTTLSGGNEATNTVDESADIRTERDRMLAAIKKGMGVEFR